MKKFLAILLALALILCAGCGKTSPEPETQVSTETEAPTETEPTETQPPETTEPPTQPLPETEDAAILLQIWSMGCADPSLPYAGNLFTEKHPICQSRSIPVRQMGCFSIVIFQK